jgi:hypothetical protein
MARFTGKNGRILARFLDKSSKKFSKITEGGVLPALDREKQSDFGGFRPDAVGFHAHVVWFRADAVRQRARAVGVRLHAVPGRTDVV